MYTGSQSILSSMIGTTLGICISTYIYNDIYTMICVYSICASINILATYKSLTYVTIDTLTIERLHYLLYDYNVQYNNNIISKPVIDKTVRIMTPDEMRLKEKW